MKRLLTSILLPIALLACLAHAKDDVRWETLRAINWVENPTNHTRMGRFGELGPYQFRPTTWRMHTRKPFQMAVQREAADEVAVKHYEWIKRNLENAGVDATPFNIALAWNSGVDNVVHGRAPDESYDYAKRVVNLVHTFEQRAAAAVAAQSEEPRPVVLPHFIPSLDRPALLLPMDANSPKFVLAAAPLPAPEPVVYTSHEPAPEKPLLVFTTTATLTPRFTLVPALGN